jgi:hypothetical protein
MLPFFNSSRLSVTPVVSSGDIVPVYVQSQGVWMGSAMSTIAAYIQSLLNTVNYFQNVYYSPATGSNITLPTNNSNQWLILSPLAALAALNVVFPGQGVAIDGQVIMVSTTQTITALSITSINTAISGVSINIQNVTPQAYKYIQVMNTWVRIS